MAGHGCSEAWPLGRGAPLVGIARVGCGPMAAARPLLRTIFGRRERAPAPSQRTARCGAHHVARGAESDALLPIKLALALYSMDHVGNALINRISSELVPSSTPVNRLLPCLPAYRGRTDSVRKEKIDAFHSIGKKRSPFFPYHSRRYSSDTPTITGHEYRSAVSPPVSFRLIGARRWRKSDGRIRCDGGRNSRPRRPIV